MSSGAIRIIVAVVPILAGPGHALGLLAADGVKPSVTRSGDSQLLSGLTGERMMRVAGAAF